MKEINTIVKISLFLLLVAQGTSCKKFLDKKSSTQLTTINRVEDLQALLDRTGFINEAIPSYGEASADDYFSNQPGTGTGEVGELAYTWQFFIEQFGVTNIANDWMQCYYPINVANICLDNINGFSKTAVNTLLWDNVKGSALFIRAFNFLNLTWTYAKAYDKITSTDDPGIPLRLTSDIKEPTIRASVAASYEQIIKDAKESLLYLPAISAHSLRPSKAAAYGLLARAYLSMRLYDSAGLYADSCLQLRSELMDYNGDVDIIGPINGINPPFRQYNKETIFYANTYTNKLRFLLSNGNADTSLYAMYNNDDNRKAAFFSLDINGYQKFKGTYTQITFKFFGGIATDEMFLIRAECYARKEMVTEAMNDLNALMIRRWKNTVPYPVITATDPTDALQKILTERRKELVFRSIRWSDIKRLNKEGAAIVLKRFFAGEPYELLPNSDKYALPIPDDIIRLTGIPQNPGWF